MALDDKAREQIALFRYGLIADLLHREGERGLYPLLREKAEKLYEIPGSRRSRVAAETIRDWLVAYRRGGFDALRPQPRRDQGRARAIPQELADLLCNLKEENPALRASDSRNPGNRCQPPADCRAKTVRKLRERQQPS